LLLSFSSQGQTITYDFEIADGSYDNTSYGDWFAANSMTYGSGKQYAGSKALVFDDDAGAYLLYEGSDGNGKDGGLGDISFWYRHWDGDGKSVKFKVQYNQAGAGWTDIGSEVTVTSTTYTQFTATVNISGDNILFRVLSTAYAERLLIDDISLSSYSGSPPATASLHISDDGSILENAESGEQITLIVRADTFVSSLSLANYSILNQPAGVSIGSITRVNDTTAILTLTGNSTSDYDLDITDFTVSVDHQELEILSSGNLSANSGVTFTALVESLAISSDGSITEGAEDGEEITLTLSNATFAATLNAANFSITNQPAGVTIGSVTRVNDQTATLTLSGNRTTDYDVDITDLTVTIAISELVGQSSPLSDNNGVTFTALVESLAISSDGSIMEGAEDGEEITLTLSGTTYAATLNAANFSITNQPAGVTIGSVTRVNDQTATLTLSGNRTTDYDVNITNFTVTIAISELVGQSSPLSDNNGVTFTALVESLAISSDGSITEGAEDGEEITLTLSGTTFAATLNAANFSITNQPTGVTIGSVTRVNDQTATLTLSGNRTTDYDVNITNFTVTIAISELVGQSSPLSDNNGVTFTALVESLAISSDGSIMEGAEDVEEITLTLSNATFAASLNAANFSITNQPAGVTIGSVTRVNDQTATLTLSGNRTTDYDVNITNFTVTIAISELVGQSSPLSDNNGITFTAVIESISLTTDGSIEEGTENGEVITVELNGAVYEAILNLINWSLTGAPTGVSIGAVSRIDDTLAEITLTGNATKDYDSDFSATVIISNVEIENYGGVDLSQGGLIFSAINDAESVTVTNDGMIEEGSENGEIVIVELDGGTFNSTLTPGNWSLSGAPAGVTISSVTRINDTIVEVTLAGNTSVDYDSDINASIRINQAEVDDYTGANIVQNGLIFTALIEPAPTVQATNIIFSGLGASQVTAQWTRGNGDYCLVVVSEDAAVSEMPADSSDYSASASFGSGDDLGSGNYAVYRGTGNSVTLTGMTQGKSYHFRVFEFNNSGLNTKYLLPTATGNPAISYTKPNDITDFELVCISTNSAYLTWTLPTGNYEGVIIAARQSNNPVHVISSGQGDTVTASSVFGNGYMFGGTTPKSYVVYNGIGNSVIITGLTPGATYTFKAYSYQDSLWSSGVNKSGQIAEVKEITNLSHYAPNHEIVLSWDNPSFNCPDEVMVVMKQGSAVTAVPTGNGSSYTASAVFGNGTDIGTGEYVVYKGQWDGLTVSGLTNGVDYHFTIFVRDDNVWSDGVSDFDTPNDITILFQGDLAVVALNTNIGGGDDEISFVCFDTLKTGTAIDFTDNGWERANLGYWGGTEGVIRITRTGVPVLPGEVITIRGYGHTPADFTVTGLSDNGWTVSSLNGNYDLNLNSTDQLWMMQYGNFSGGGTSHLGVYSGNVLYGWTATGWAGDPGHGTGTSYSALYPFAECFNTNVANTAYKDKVKYMGPLTATTRREWLARINNSSNWTGYSANTTYDAARDYAGGLRFDILTNVYDDGEWVGDEDSNWFNCSNWGNLLVPDENTDVVINSTAQRTCIIDENADFSDDYQDTAECNNFIINDSSFTFQHNSEVLRIWGDLEINGGSFTMNGSTVLLHGDFVSNSANAFHGSSGLVRFEGDVLQKIENNSTALTFDKVELDNAYHLNLEGDLEMNLLDFSAGKAYLGGENLTINDSITGYSTASYIVMENDKSSTGFLTMNLTTANKVIPVGNSGGYNPILAQLGSGSADFQFRIFDTVYSNGVSGSALTGNLVNKTWIIKPLVVGTYSANFRVQWNLNDESALFSADRSGAVFFYNSLIGVNPTWSTLPGGGPVQGTNPFKYSNSGITNFGAFSIGDNCTINKPITSNIFHF